MLYCFCAIHGIYTGATVTSWKCKGKEMLFVRWIYIQFHIRLMVYMPYSTNDNTFNTLWTNFSFTIYVLIICGLTCWLCCVFKITIWYDQFGYNFSKNAVFNGVKAIRGGIPVVFRELLLNVENTHGSTFNLWLHKLIRVMWYL